VDDRPFGGGPGMVFKPEPIFRAVEAIRANTTGHLPVILLSPQGRLWRQPVVGQVVTACADEAASGHLVLICGRYEGVDHRVAEALTSDELSIGDYVLSGGELPAAVVIESCTRLLPGVMGNEESGLEETFSSAASRLLTDAPGDACGRSDPDSGSCQDEPSRGPGCGLIGFPQYTRPAEFRGLRVPEVLLSGNHEQIRRWRRRQTLERTWRRRPELLGTCALSAEDQEILLEVTRSESPSSVARQGPQPSPSRQG